MAWNFAGNIGDGYYMFRVYIPDPEPGLKGCSGHQMMMLSW